MEKDQIYPDLKLIIIVGDDLSGNPELRDRMKNRGYRLGKLGRLEIYNEVAGGSDHHDRQPAAD